VIDRSSERVAGCDVYKRFLAKARPDLVFKYLSKSKAFCRFVNAIAVLIRHGLYFTV